MEKANVEKETRRKMQRKVRPPKLKPPNPKVSSLKALKVRRKKARRKKTTVSQINDKTNIPGAEGSALITIARKIIVKAECTIREFLTTSRIPRRITICEFNTGAATDNKPINPNQIGKLSPYP